jgi:hypothetical protein
VVVNPTNADLQGQINTVHTRLDGIDTRLETVPTKEDVRKIFSDELGKFFKGTGNKTKLFLVGAAVVIGSLTVIFGGIKALLGFLGFAYVNKI